VLVWRKRLVAKKINEDTPFCPGFLLLVLVTVRFGMKLDFVVKSHLRSLFSMLGC
jgi:hypothetical protein